MATVANFFGEMRGGVSGLFSHMNAGKRGIAIEFEARIRQGDRRVGWRRVRMLSSRTSGRECSIGRVSGIGN